MTLNDPLWMQNASYSASEDRDLIAAAFPNVGVVGASSLAVTQRGAGPNMSVDVSAGLVVIPNAVSSRGKYLCRSTATENVTLEAAPGSGNSRYDLIVASVSDTEYGDLADAWTIEAITGVPGADPDVPATPAGSTLLAVVTVGELVSTIVNANIADQRQYAAAVTYADRLPFYAADGQIVVSSEGITSVRSAGSWVSTVDPSRFGGGTTTVIGATLSTVGAGFATVTIPQPAGAVFVSATFAGHVITTGGDPAFAEVRVQISFNGGSTWTDGRQVTATTENAFYTQSITAVHGRSGTPSGDIKARIFAKRLNTEPTDVTGGIVVTVVPA